MASDPRVFPGACVTPDDPRYPALVRGFNQRWVGAPRRVQVIGDEAQLVEVVQRCVDDGSRMTARSGGHCYEGWSSLTDGVILDLSPLAGAGWDDAVQAYFIEGGATNWDVQNQLYRRYGVTIPSGSCYSVGAGGHIAGGGHGILSRLHGLTVDWLHGVEGVFVGADRRARRVRATRDSTDPAERELLWAHTGGGGGSFGVVTRYLFRELPPGPVEAHLASLAWEWPELLAHPDQLSQILRTYGSFFEQHSAVGSPFSSLFAVLHLTRKAAGQVILTAQSVGHDSAPLEAFLDAMRAGVDGRRVRTVPQRAPVGWAHPVSRSTAVRSMPWLEAAQTLNGSGPNQRAKYKSAYLKRAFPEAQHPTLWKWLTVEDETYPANPQALIQVESYGCQINAVPPGATAVPQRSSILKLQYQTYWTSPAEDAQNLAWIRDFYREMYGERGPLPDDEVDGCYVNYCDADLKEWQTLYYQDGYPRLQAVKAAWDPHDLWNHAQSIELPGG